MVVVVRYVDGHGHVALVGDGERAHGLPGVEVARRAVLGLVQHPCRRGIDARLGLLADLPEDGHGHGGGRLEVVQQHALLAHEDARRVRRLLHDALVGGHRLAHVLDVLRDVQDMREALARFLRLARVDHVQEADRRGHYYSSRSV